MYTNYTGRRFCGGSNSCNSTMEMPMRERPIAIGEPIIYDNTCAYVPNSIESPIDMCECGFNREESLFPENPMFGQSYVPWQVMDKTFTPEVGLREGTIFPELVMPYYPGQSLEEMKYLERTNKIGKGCNG